MDATENEICRSPAATRPFAVNACYSAAAVAEIVGKSVQHVRFLCKTKRIPARRCGGDLISGWAVRDDLSSIKTKRSEVKNA